MSDDITAPQIIRLICKQVLDAFRSLGADTVCPNPALGGTNPTGFSHLPGKKTLSYLPGRTLNLAGVITLAVWVHPP